MTSLLQRIKADQITARKNRESEKAILLTTLIGEAERVGKDAGNRESTDEEVMAVIKKFVKNAKDFMDSTKGVQIGQQDGGSKLEEWGDKLRQEVDLLEQYLPQQLTKEQLMNIISTGIQSGKFTKDAKSKGAIMKHLKESFAGQYDGKVAAEAVDAVLRG